MLSSCHAVPRTQLHWSPLIIFLTDSKPVIPRKAKNSLPRESETVNSEAAIKSLVILIFLAISIIAAAVKEYTYMVGPRLNMDAYRIYKKQNVPPCLVCKQQTNLKCSACQFCHTVFVCSKDCFRSVWKDHRQDCSNVCCYCLCKRARKQTTIKKLSLWS
jgi:hypothetical protein